jgi:hypothetical protein
LRVNDFIGLRLFQLRHLLKNNIHTQTNDSKTYRANYENWTSPGAGHGIFPVNTVVEIEHGRIGFYIIEKKPARKLTKLTPVWHSIVPMPQEVILTFQMYLIH